MNKSIFLILLLIFTSFFSCQKESSFQGETADFGTVDYYKPFLFFECDTLVLTKNLKYNFNAYSIEQESKVTVKLVDKSQNTITNKNIQFFINDNLIENNNFTLDSKKTQRGDLKISLKFLPEYPNGYASGYLSVSNHSLDVINNNDLNSSKEKRLFKWEATHRLVMNPLKKWIIYLGAIIVAALLLWFLVLRNKIYSKFKKGKIQILSPYFKVITISTNTRLIVFTNSYKKQNALSSLFVGKIIYEVNPLFQKDIFLRPGKGTKIKIKLPLGARINPMVNSLKKFNNYSIQLEKEKIEIQYS